MGGRARRTSGTVSLASAAVSSPVIQVQSLFVQGCYYVMDAFHYIRYGVVANIIASHAIARGSIPRVGRFFVVHALGAFTERCHHHGLSRKPKTITAAGLYCTRYSDFGFIPDLLDFHHHCSHNPGRDSSAQPSRDRDEMPIPSSRAKLSYIRLTSIRGNSVYQAASS